jgi:hypothetical protein
MKSPEDPPIAPANAAYNVLATTTEGGSTWAMGGKFVGFPSLRFCSSDLERRTDDSGMSRDWDQLAIGTVERKRYEPRILYDYIRILQHGIVLSSTARNGLKNR